MRQSASEGIIKKVKGDDAEQRRAKQRQCIANHRARENGKQRYQQVISIIGSVLLVNIFVSPFSCQTSNCRLLASHIIHMLSKRVPHYMSMCVLLHNQLHVHDASLNLHLFIKLHVCLCCLGSQKGQGRKGGTEGACLSAHVVPGWGERQSGQWPIPIHSKRQDLGAPIIIVTQIYTSILYAINFRLVVQKHNGEV